jgi:simple sugar transport system substrate-binding protein
MITKRTLGVGVASGALASVAARAQQQGGAAGPVDAGRVSPEIRQRAAGKKYTMATVVKVDGIAWFDRMRAGVQQFGRDTGHDVRMVGPSQADAAAQVQLVDNLISQGVDAICIVPFSVEAVEPVLRRARQRGIVVVAHEASNLANADYVIEAFDNRAYGAKLMDELGKRAGGEGKYVCTVGSLTSQSHMEWMDGAIAHQRQHFPKMQEAVRRVESYDDAEVAYNRLREVLTAHPDLRGILGAPMPASAGAGRLIAERGMRGRLLFSGTGLVSVAGQYLRDGDIQYIQFWDPAVAGYAMNTIAAMHLRGGAHRAAVKAGLDLGLPGYDKLTAPEGARAGLLYGAGWVGVTRETMGQYNF